MKQSLKKYLVPGEHNDHSPHFLKPKVVASFSLSLIVLKIFLGIALAFMPFLAFADSSLSTEALLECTNKNRVDRNLNALVLNPLLSRGAQEKLADMDDYDYWAHINPTTGSDPWLFFDNATYPFITAGENLAFKFRTSDGVCKGWMDSPTHRANILDPTYQEIGFAVRDIDLGNNGKGVLVVQFLGSRLDFHDQPQVVVDEVIDCEPAVPGGPEITSPECGYINTDRPEIKAKTVDGQTLNFKINEEDYAGKILEEGDNRIIRLPEGYELNEGTNRIEALLIEQNRNAAVTTVNVDTSAPVIDEDSLNVEYALREGNHVFELEVAVNDKNLEGVYITYTNVEYDYAQMPLQLLGENMYFASLAFPTQQGSVIPITLNAHDKAGNSNTLSVELIASDGDVRGIIKTDAGEIADKFPFDLEEIWRYMVSGFLMMLFAVSIITSIVYKFKHENDDYMHNTAQTVIIGILMVVSIYFLF